MCGRFAQVFEDTDVSRLEEIIRAACSSDELLIPSFNTAPTDPAGSLPNQNPADSLWSIAPGSGWSRLGVRAQGPGL